MKQPAAGGRQGEEIVIQEPVVIGIRGNVFSLEGIGAKVVELWDSKSCKGLGPDAQRPLASLLHKNNLPIVEAQGDKVTVIVEADETLPWAVLLFAVLLAQHHSHASAHSYQTQQPRAGWPLAVALSHDTMIDHDKNVGEMLDLLDDLGIAENTFVMYSTDNGPHMNTWPDGAMTPFRSAKDTNWEGAFRVPLLVRWPSKIPARSVSNEIVQHHDWLRTFLSMSRRKLAK